MEVFLGTLHRAAVEPWQILAPALARGAAGVVVFHTHPSADPTPSLEDLSFTRRLYEACNAVGVTLVDHLILGGTRRWESLPGAAGVVTDWCASFGSPKALVPWRGESWYPGDSRRPPMPTALSLEDLGIRQPPPLSVPQSRPASDGASERTHIEEDLPRFTREMTAKLERLATQAEDEVATEGVEFLDGLIDRLAAIEEGTRAQWREMKKTQDKGSEIRKILQDLPESAAGRQVLLQSVEEPVARIEAWIEASEALLPAYRDARWKLMALRADHEDAGDAPVFEDPELLEQYLTRG